MLRILSALMLLLGLAACSSAPKVPVDPLAQLLEPGEQVEFRARAQLLHGHDPGMEPPWDPVDGYKPIPTYQGEMAVTDRRLLFVELPAGEAPSWASIPLDAIARARPSRTPLLNYVVVWDHAQHPDAFIVDARHLKALHQAFGQVMLRRKSGAHPPPQSTPQHALPAR